MIFSIAQINDIISILRRHQLVFIAEQLGLNYLSQADKDLLLAAGVDLAKYTNSQGIIEHAFLFGLLSEALGDERSKDMTYDQFKKFLKSGNFIPLTEDEEFARPASRPHYSVLNNSYWIKNGFKPLRSYKEAIKDYLKHL